MAGLVERIRAMRARRAEGRTERAVKKARAEAQRLEHRRDVGGSGADALGSVRRSRREG
jgi:hypothetical protein